jgi:hypothetical protein
MELVIDRLVPSPSLYNRIVNIYSLSISNSRLRTIDIHIEYCFKLIKN